MQLLVSSWSLHGLESIARLPYDGYQVGITLLPTIRWLLTLLDRILVSDKCHVDLDLHTKVDGLEEVELGKTNIGTTGKGISGSSSPNSSDSRCLSGGCQWRLRGRLISCLPGKRGLTVTCTNGKYMVILCWMSIFQKSQSSLTLNMTIFIH